MKSKFTILALALLVLTLAAVSQQFSYVGAQKCQICHKTEAQGRQYAIWEGTKHAKTTEALTSPKAAEFAKAMGDKQACLMRGHGITSAGPDVEVATLTAIKLNDQPRTSVLPRIESDAAARFVRPSSCS